MAELGILRAVRDNDLELMLSWRNNPAVREKMYTRHEISLSEHRDWWARTKERDDLEYRIYEQLGVPLGVVALTDIDFVNSNCCWAFYADPEAPRGTGSRMEYLALERAFDGLHLKKLYCEVLDFNAAVIKLHQKFGFLIEGTLRKQHKYLDKYIDVIRLGLLESEWNNIRAEVLKRLVPRANR